MHFLFPPSQLHVHLNLPHSTDLGWPVHVKITKFFVMLYPNLQFH